MKRRHNFLPKPKAFRTQPLVGKVTLSLFWNERGAVLEHNNARRETVTGALHVDLFKNQLHSVINGLRSKHISSAVTVRYPTMSKYHKFLSALYAVKHSVTKSKRRELVTS